MYTDCADEYSFSRSYLTPGETILWKGKPGEKHLFTSQDFLMIPFSVLWCGFAVFWEYSVITSGAPFFFALFGIPFVCMGLYLVFGRFFWTAYIRKRTRYVITNLKIIRLRGRRIDMLDGRHMPPMHMNAYSDGSGTITFGYRPLYGFGMRKNYHGNTAPFSLEAVDQVALVHQIILRMNQP